MIKVLLILALVLVGLFFYHRSQAINKFATFYSPQQWQGVQAP